MHPDDPTPPPSQTARTEPDPTAPRSTARRARGCLFEIVETVVLTLVIFLGIQTFVAQPYRVEGLSMESTLEPDQYVLIDKLTPRWSAYDRGDIVVLDPPEDAAQGGTPFIKRVIALAGDRVELRDGDVYVNGTRLDEPYVFTDDDGEPQDTRPIAGDTAWTVPDGSVFVLGDHRRASSDSRLFGPIEIAHILGRAWLRYWPMNVFGLLEEATAAAEPAE